jgi:site-specific recombinase XerC
MNLQTDVNWDGYLRELPLEMTDSIRRYVMHCSLNLREENCIRQTRSLLSELSAFSRSTHLTCIQEIAPRVWFIHIESRMKAGIKPTSLNTTLRIVQSFLCYLKINGVPVCETMLAVRPLKTGETLPRDLTASQVNVLLQIVSTPMDGAWILLMLHSGLRTCEVRSLRWCD